MKWLIAIVFLGVGSSAWAYTGPGGMRCGSQCCDSYEILISGMQKSEFSRTWNEVDMVAFSVPEVCKVLKPEPVFGTSAWDECLKEVIEFYRAECPLP